MSEGKLNIVISWFTLLSNLFILKKSDSLYPQQKFLNLDYPNEIPYIPPGGNSPHPQLPFSFPNEIKVLLVVIFLMYIFIPTRTKILSVLLAFCFSCIEPIFYILTKEDPITGSISIAWNELCQGSVGRIPHTTFEQFIVNLIFSGPFFLIYYAIFNENENDNNNENNPLQFILPHKWGHIELLRCILIPMLIWGLEIVEGFLLIAMYGWNPAWIYRGRDALFLGTICLEHAKYWIGLGFIMEIIGWQIVKKVMYESI